MLTKKLNAIVLIASQILNFTIMLYFAVLLAKLVWWVINPSISEVYVEKTSATQYDKSVKYIVNRYPFGVIAKAIEVKNVAPPIASQIKLTGIYFNPPNNSIAFIEYNGKAHTLRLDGAVIENASLTAINIDSIVITQNNESATIEMSPGSGTATSVTIPSGDTSKRRNPMSRVEKRQPADVTANPGNPPASGNDEFRERRKKLIEEFAKPQAAIPSNNDGSANSADANTANNNNPMNAGVINANTTNNNNPMNASVINANSANKINSSDANNMVNSTANQNK